MSRWRGLIGLVFLVGCEHGDENEVLVGRHIDVEIEAGLEPCGDLVGHMDRFIELVAAEWRVDLTERHYTYRWTSVETYVGEGYCPGGTLGCVHGRHAESFTAPLDHELVHLVTGAVGQPRSFFIEGAAVAFDLPISVYLQDTIASQPIDRDLMTATGLPGDAYDLAGAYTRLLIDRFGMAAYLEFYASVPHDADYADIAAAHADAFGEPLDETIAAFDMERRDCPRKGSRFKLFECAAPEIAWQDDTLRLQRGVSCADEDVVGPFYLFSRATTWSSFTVEQGGLFELSATSDPVNVQITIGSCGGCDTSLGFAANVGLGPRRVVLDAGDYYLQLDGPIDADAAVSLELRRVAGQVG